MFNKTENSTIRRNTTQHNNKNIRYNKMLSMRTSTIFDRSASLGEEGLSVSICDLIRAIHRTKNRQIKKRKPFNQKSVKIKFVK